MSEQRDAAYKKVASATTCHEYATGFRDTADLKRRFEM
jgi:hypothetical protein